MATLEEEVILPLQRQLAAQSAIDVARRTPRVQFWPFYMIVTVSLLMSLAGTSLYLLKDEFGKAWRTSISQFEWLVLAEGDQVAIDEVGRFLGKIDGVADTKFVSSDETYQAMKNDPTLAPDLALLNGNPFPACWRVRWKPESFSAERIQQALDDVKMFPGVIDVASDPNAMRKIHLFRMYWYRLKFVLSLFIMTGVGLFSVFFGRLLFFTPRGTFSRKVGLYAVLASVLSAAAGFAAVYYLW